MVLKALSDAGSRKTSVNNSAGFKEQDVERGTSVRAEGTGEAAAPGENREGWNHGEDGEDAEKAEQGGEPLAGP